MIDGSDPAQIIAVIGHELERALRSDDVDLLAHLEHVADEPERDSATFRSV
jgi:hypothetical protein